MATITCNESPSKSAQRDNPEITFMKMKKKTNRKTNENDILFRVYFGRNIERLHLSRDWWSDAKSEPHIYGA
jgi:hypothetical protein